MFKHALSYSIVWKTIPAFGPDFGDLGFHLVGFGGLWWDFVCKFWRTFGDTLDCFSCSFGGFLEGL